MSKPNEKKSIVNYGSEQIIKDAGSLSFFTPLGTTDNVDSFIIKNDSQNSSVTHSVLGAGNAVPGICVIDYDLVPGLSLDGNSALNIASKKLYTFVRHVNSGSRNYDSPDLMNFAFSAVSLFCFMPEIKRAYGACMKYSGKNRYLGKAIVDALGFDYNDFKKNLADIRAWYNMTICKLNAIKVPSSWPMWTKNYIFNTVLLKDGEIDRSQIYALRNCVIWKYNETGTQIGNLTPVFPFGNSSDQKLTFSQLVNIISPLIDAFVASEDINIMSGDILKAYGDDKCMELELLPDDYVIEPVYNAEILEIVHNTTIYYPERKITKGYLIKQDQNVNGLLFNPEIPVQVITDMADTDNVSAELIEEREYLDSMFDDITQNKVINMSIMTELLEKDTLNNKIHFASLGTELPHGCAVYVLPDPYNSHSLKESYAIQRVYPLTDTYLGFTDATKNLLVEMSCLQVFDWAPRMTVFMLATGAWSTAQNRAFAMKLFDLYNYTVIGKSDLKKIHDLHVLGGFGLAE